MTAPQDDSSFVPGLGPAPDLPEPRTETPRRLEQALEAQHHSASQSTGRPARLDPALDPDRYDPTADARPAGPLDPALDPDRYDPAREVPPGQGQTLPQLLGEGAFEDKRDNYQWALGLAGVLVFLALVSWLFGSVVRA
jgi:hypothetical protein